jgi:mRNA interferase MazF
LRTSKRRPALIVQADSLGADLPLTIVAMLASNMARSGHPSRVIVKDGSVSAKESGLLMDSVVMTDNSEIDHVIGTLTGLKEIDAALRTTLAL